MDKKTIFPSTNLRHAGQMGENHTVLGVARWIGDILRAIPAPTESWAAIVGHLAWPLLILFLVYRFRSFLGSFLWTLADRIKTDHVKLGWFEIRPNDEVLVLDPQNVGESTNEFDPADIQRIERMFEFIETEANFARLNEWVGTEIGIDVDIEDFLTLPVYASERAQAFERVEGLKND